MRVKADTWAAIRFGPPGRFSSVPKWCICKQVTTKPLHRKVPKLWHRNQRWLDNGCTRR
uniref:Uncharacterized protein n=1 Tax=Helianthus annuus TaxID=4232 RepID=A0A251UZF5_HELAN